MSLNAARDLPTIGIKCSLSRSLSFKGQYVNSPGNETASEKCLTDRFLVCTDFEEDLWKSVLFVNKNMLSDGTTK